MRLSAPLYRLKRKARLMSRDRRIPLHQALDDVAAEEGFGRWSLLAARAGMGTPASGTPGTAAPAGALFASLVPGDMLLIGARPGHGKTLLALELAVEAVKAGRRGIFFTLEYTGRDVVERLRALGIDPAGLGDRFELDMSDTISAAHIASVLAGAPRGTFAAVDYLQLLDQRRDTPPLADQIRSLAALARERGFIIAFIAQIDRAYDPAAKPFPDLADIRLPNPLDLSLFSRACFLNNGEIQVRLAG